MICSWSIITYINLQIIFTIAKVIGEKDNLSKTYNTNCLLGLFFLRNINRFVKHKLLQFKRKNQLFEEDVRVQGEINRASFVKKLTKVPQIYGKLTKN